MAAPATPVHAQPATFAVRPAGTADWDIRIGAAHSDNILRVPVDPQSGRYDLLGTNFNYLRDNNRIALDFYGDLEIREYADPNIDSEPVGRLNATVNFGLLPERVRWLVTDRYGVGRINPYIATNPQNRQIINVFTTGPTFDIPIGGRTSFEMSLLRTDTNYEETVQVDSESDEVSMAFYRSLTQSSAVGIGGSARDLTYANSVTGNDRRTLFLQYRRSLLSGNASVQVGRTEVDTGTRTLETPLVNLDWVRNVGSRSRVGFLIERGFSDAASAFFRDVTGAAGVGSILVINVREPYRFERVNVNYTLTNTRTTIGFYLGAGRARYSDITTLDNDEKFYGVNFRRQLSPRLDLAAAFNIMDRTFTTADFNDGDRSANLSLTREFGRRWSLRGLAERFTRERNSLTNSYDETQIRLELVVDMNP